MVTFFERLASPRYICNVSVTQAPEHIQVLLKTIPDSPGVYQYYDQEGRILYVGKAKNLKKRVSSYFTKDKYDSRKTALLVRKIRDIKFIVVESELDALLLENNLIKQHQPKYNVLLKDDKTFPWICIKKEPFPRIFPTRRIVKDGSQYFGPYANVKMMHTLLDLIRQLYPLRTCTLKLTQENIKAEKFKVCLEYHIGNCKGPCVDKQTEVDYALSIQHIKKIIKGNIREVLDHLQNLMTGFSAKLEFENAQLVKEKIVLLQRFQSRSTVVSPVVSNADVFSIVSDVKSAYVNYMRVIEGAIVQAHTIELKKKLEESDEELLKMAIVEFSQRFESESKEYIIPFELDLEIPNVKMLVPQRGDRSKLLKLSERNALTYKRDKDKQTEILDPERNVTRIMEQMQKDLRMKEQPRHIECFDNSNIQGDFPVAAMVCFRNGKPFKSDYRHYNIKTVVGPDDFASMEEVVLRRYKRMLEEGLSLPQLIVIDGGKGQLSSAVKSLELLGLRGKITIIGIAKKLEEIYFPGDSVPLYIDKRSESLKIIQHARNEAHRFGITHHRNKRSKATVKSELTAIKGISHKSSEQLLWKFRSVKKVKEATEAELMKAVGKAKAKVVFEYFHPS
ncbi:MAG: excinuclease ABC subunit UvrC [Flavobacteriales bacterium]|nr:excinuclease ABC subunit UvrC [Flavobacteriales bacterium]